MAWGVPRYQRYAFDGQSLSVGYPHGDDIDAAFLSHHGDAAGAISQRAESADVIGVHVGVYGLDQFEVELFEQLKIAIDLLQHGIDDQRLAAFTAGEQIGVSAGDRVEKLAKDHFETLKVA